MLHCIVCFRSKSYSEKLNALLANNIPGFGLWVGKQKLPHGCYSMSSKGVLGRDRATFLRLGGLNKMTKASVLGGSGGMLPRKMFKINASRMAKNTSQYSRHSELFYYLSG